MLATTLASWREGEGPRVTSPPGEAGAAGPSSSGDVSNVRVIIPPAFEAAGMLELGASTDGVAAAAAEAGPSGRIGAREWQSEFHVILQHRLEHLVGKQRGPRGASRHYWHSPCKYGRENASSAAQALAYRQDAPADVTYWHSPCKLTGNLSDLAKFIERSIFYLKYRTFYFFAKK